MSPGGGRWDCSGALEKEEGPWGRGQWAVASLVWVPMAALGPLCFVVGAPFPITERAGLQQPLPVLTACDPSLTGLTETNGKAFVTRPEKRDGRTYHLCPPPAGL